MRVDVMAPGTIIAIVFVVMAFFATYLIARAWRGNSGLQKIGGVVFIIVLLAAANRILFLEISLRKLGGTSENGKVDDNHYYVGSHGTYHEVPYNVYMENMWYDRLSDEIASGSFLLLLLVMLFLGLFRQPRTEWSLEALIRPRDKR